MSSDASTDTERPADEDAQPALTIGESVVQALASWRTAAVSLLSFSSGLPLGLVWIAIPDWMRSVGVDIRIVGLFTLAQAPWAYKMVWAPFMDRYSPPLLGRRRGWALVTQLVLCLLILGLAGLGHHPETPWVVLALTLALAFTAASQDIAIDAYTVEVLKREEQGAVVGARIAFYRAAMYVAGGVSITLAGATSWPLANALMAALFLPMMLITWKAPPPPRTFAPPRTLKEAVWLPFLGFLARHRALEILAFVLLYKIADNLAEGLLRPFLFDKGFTAFDRGISLATIGLVGIVGGTFIGGLWTNVMGLGKSLWVFGFLQIFSNLGYVVLAGFPTSPDQPPDQLQTWAMYGALSFEKFTSGLGTGAFSVLLLRMTQKRFSATPVRTLHQHVRYPAHHRRPDRRLRRARLRLAVVLLGHHPGRHPRLDHAPALLAPGHPRAALRGRAATLRGAAVIPRPGPARHRRRRRHPAPLDPGVRLPGRAIGL